jgi:protoheme IX farnesyltransferase
VNAPRSGDIDRSHSFTSPLDAVHTIFRLARIRLSIAAAFPSLAGYFCANGSLNLKGVFVFLGVVFVAVASSVFNQLMEKRADGLMPRTRSRPLPRRIVSHRQAVFLGSASVVVGFFLLLLSRSAFALLLSAGTAVLYGVAYTPLKRHNRYALFIGAIVGAMPFSIGYTAANGGAVDRFLLVTLFMFVWQIAHFFLLLTRYGKEYEAAGVPTFASSMSDRFLGRSLVAWIFACALSAALFPLVGIIQKEWASVVLYGASGCMALFFLFAGWRSNYALSFSLVYSYQVAVLLLLVIDKLPLHHG